MEQEERKLRGLFVIKADGLFDETHPLWQTIETYRPLLEETHVLVFSRGKVSKKLVLTQPKDGLFLYQCSSRRLLIRGWQTWRLLAFQLYWRKKFRADFVLSFTPGRGGLFSYILSRRFKRPFFMVASLRMANDKRRIKRAIARFLLRSATMVFVPGSDNALALSKLLSIPPAQLVPLQPPVDIQTISHPGDYTDYHAMHPQYNFFITCAAETTETIREQLFIHAQIAAKYPRVALIVLAPRGRSELFTDFIKKAKAYGVFVQEYDDHFLSKLAGSHAYLAINDYDEVDTTLLYALGLGMPSVAYRTGTAAELFSGTPYERFACSPKDTDAAAKLLIDLVEHQVTRNEYSINTGLLFKKFTPQTTEAYVAALHENISMVLRPPKEGVSVAVMMKKELESLKNAPDTVG